jgi:transposase-like protein
MDDFYFYKIEIMKRKSEDLKLIAVRHYLEKYYNYDETFRIFEFPTTSLKRWVARFQSSGGVSRKKRTYVSYKITHHQVQEAMAILKKHPTISMKELFHQFKNTY